MNTPTKSIVSALLAVPWYCALLIPPETRNELLGGNGRSPARLALLMVLTSMVVSLPLWWLLRRRRPLGAWALAAITPPAVAFAFSSLVYATDTLTHLLRTESPYGAVVAFYDQLGNFIVIYCVGVPVAAYVALEQSYYVAFPMGLLHVGAIAFLANRPAARVESGAGDGQVGLPDSRS